MKKKTRVKTRNSIIKSQKYDGEARNNETTMVKGGK
jgi:hypothetical protein